MKKIIISSLIVLFLFAFSVEGAQGDLRDRLEDISRRVSELRQVEEAPLGHRVREMAREEEDEEDLGMRVREMIEERVRDREEENKERAEEIRERVREMTENLSQSTREGVLDISDTINRLNQNLTRRYINLLVSSERFIAMSPESEEKEMLEEEAESLWEKIEDQKLKDYQEEWEEAENLEDIRGGMGRMVSLLRLDHSEFMEEILEFHRKARELFNKN